MAASFDVCVIGHVSRDINAIGGVELEPSPGGAAYYSTMVYRRLGLRAAVVIWWPRPTRRCCRS